MHVNMTLGGHEGAQIGPVFVELDMAAGDKDENIAGCSRCCSSYSLPVPFFFLQHVILIAEITRVEVAAGLAIIARMVCWLLPFGSVIWVIRPRPSRTKAMPLPAE